MTPQEIFDVVSEHLLTQNYQSVKKITKTVDDQEVIIDLCRYRGLNGTECSIGCLISDEHYLPKIEGKAVSYLVRRYNFPNINLINLELLTKLQKLHDDHLPEVWPEQLLIMAHSYNFNPSERLLNAVSRDVFWAYRRGYDPFV